MALQQNLHDWPTLDEYDTALTDAPTTVHDADIRGAKLLRDSRPLRMNGQSGKYVSVYKMGDWAVKCFCTNPITPEKIIKPPPDISERYQAISDYMYLHRQRLIFLVPQIWVQRAITINRQAWPFIKANFIQAPILGEFLAEMRQESFVIAALAKQWFAIIDTLESLHIAHGDLDVTNVLVSGTYPHVALHLVDFDSMYVPALHGREMYEQGHEHFQAPFQRHFDAEMDRFSALVIYLSLIALAENPQLWEQCKANEESRLLLSSDDFRGLDNSSAYKVLRTQQNNRELQLCLDELASSIYDARVPRGLSAVLSSPPPERVRTVPRPRPLPPSYIASPIPIPVQFITSNTQPPATIPVPHVTSNAQPPITIPIPTSYLQSPSAADQTPPPAPITPSKSAIWWLLAFMMLVIVIAIILLVLHV
jgi:hypothetical protein